MTAGAVDDVLGIGPGERQLADALAGDPGALEALAGLDRKGDLAHRHRAGAALYLRAAGLGLQPPASWHRELVAMAARHLQRQATVEDIARQLDPAGIEWTVIKGYDLATRVYELPEERPAADIDVLIRPERLDPARRLLEADGWRALFEGPRNRRFLAEEGYAWMAGKPGQAFLELHFRLWGLVPARFAMALLDRSVPDPPLPGRGRRPRLADAYLLAAVHEWLTPPPRHLVAWWDLARIGERLAPDEIGEVVEGARSWDLQLPVALAAEVSAALWRGEACREISRRLAESLRWVERGFAARARQTGLVTWPLSRLQSARLLAGRRGRQRWWGAWRRLWPHPGIVERATPDSWPWLRRRLVYQIPPLRRRLRSG